MKMKNIHDRNPYRLPKQRERELQMSCYENRRTKFVLYVTQWWRDILS